MFRLEALLVLATMALSVTAGASRSTQIEVPAITGAWAGHIDLPTGALPISISLARGGDGAWTGTIDIPAQGAKACAQRHHVDDAAVTFVHRQRARNPTFKGTLVGGSWYLSGTFSQNGGRFRSSCAPRCGHGRREATCAAAAGANAPASVCRRRSQLPERRREHSPRRHVHAAFRGWSVPCGASDHRLGRTGSR